MPCDQKVVVVKIACLFVRYEAHREVYGRRCMEKERPNQRLEAGSVRNKLFPKVQGSLPGS